MTRVAWKVLLSSGLVASLVGCATVAEKQPSSALAQADTPVPVTVSEPAPAAVKPRPSRPRITSAAPDVRQQKNRLAAAFANSLIQRAILVAMGGLEPPTPAL